VIPLSRIAGVRGYPEGFAEPRNAYREELRSPLHGQCVVRTDARAPAGAVILGADWRLVLPAEADDQLRTAAADFARFMAVAMACPLQVAQADPGSAGPEDRAVVLALTPHQLRTPESYVIHAGPERVLLRGADATGLQYALYDLEERMASAGGPFLEPCRLLRHPWLENRLLRSFFSPYYRNELLSNEDYYPEEYLNRLAHHRINGVWLHVKLRDIVPSAVFPEFGQDAEAALPRLRALVERAARYGIRVFLYLNEPRNLPEASPFWRAHPHLRGAPSASVMDDEPSTFALCTSRPETLAFLRDSSRRLFTDVPGLGGVFLITASEHHTHCFSHTRAQGDPPYEQLACPRCRERRPVEVVVETVRAIAEGVHEAAPGATVIAWNWSWEGLYGREAEHEIIRSLPPDVVYMADFERGDVKTILGRRVPIDEYALSLVGPSERFRAANAVAREGGRPVYAKLQFVNTHELANIPYLPLPGVVYEKLAGLREAGAAGILGCWIFGNYPGLITDLAGRLYLEPFDGDRAGALAELARLYFGPEAVPDVLVAWECFAEAWDYYPFHIPILYSGPQVKGPAFPWFLEPIHEPVPPNWRDNQPPGDNLVQLIPDHDALWFDRALGELLAAWERGLLALESAFDRIAEPTRRQYLEYGVARCAYHQIVSLRNTVRFYVEREFLLRSPSEEERRAILARLRGHIEAEIENAEACLPYVEADSRLGWHSECFMYQFTPEEIRERVAALREMAEVTIPGWLEAGTGLVAVQEYSEPLTDAAYERLREHLHGVDLRKGIYPR